MAGYWDVPFDRSEMLAQLDVSDRVDAPAYTSLGTPVIDEDGTSDAAMGQMMRPPMARVLPESGTLGSALSVAYADVDARLSRDLNIMKAIGLKTRRTNPYTRLTPGDYAQIRAFLGTGAVLDGERVMTRQDADSGPILRCLEGLGRVLLIHDAAPFFIPGGLASSLMTSEPPDADLVANLRLPFASVATFFDAVALGELKLDDRLVDVTVDEEAEAKDMSLVGVVMFAGADGMGLKDLVFWIVSGPMRDVYGIFAVSGFWQHGEQPGIVTNLAALCTWNQWRPPPDDPRQLEGEQDSRQWRRSLSKSAVRKSISRGGVLGVNVIDVTEIGGGSSTNTDDSSRGVREHWRRGFWNTVRIATRDAEGNIVGDRLGEQGRDWHYEGRWIHPTLVHGRKKPDESLTVYTMPDEPVST